MALAKLSVDELETLMADSVEEANKELVKLVK